MQRTQISVTPPEHFNFAVTVNSHGWERLAPFSLDRETQVLTRTERLPSQLARLEMSNDGQINVTVTSEKTLSPEDQTYVREFVRRCLAFDWDLSRCYAQVAGDPTYGFIQEQGLGRLLLAPTMWENLVKTQFLTNTHARHTTSMATKFGALGDAFAGGYAFPTPEQVLAWSADELAEQTGTGYRARYIRRLAEETISGFDPETLRNAGLRYEEVYERVRALQGFGPYSASYVLKLLGRFERVSIDTVMRRYFKEISGQENPSDQDIGAYYERFGDFRGLVAWWDVSRRADDKGELAF
jgi:3-methyladenine DNA glycosylase/8-oxoguanine DNA glycosylase